MKIGKDSACRYCGIHKETIDHRISACRILAGKEYLERHNQVAQYVHWHIYNNYKFTVGEKWYQHETPPVVESDKTKIL